MGATHGPRSSRFEPPGRDGDPGRHIALGRDKQGSFAISNRGKKSVVVDPQAIPRSVRHYCPVRAAPMSVVTSFSPGAVRSPRRRLRRVRERNPRFVYARLARFGDRTAHGAAARPLWISRFEAESGIAAWDSAATASRARLRGIPAADVLRDCRGLSVV